MHSFSLGHRAGGCGRTSNSSTRSSSSARPSRRSSGAPRQQQQQQPPAAYRSIRRRTALLARAFSSSSSRDAAAVPPHHQAAGACTAAVWQGPAVDWSRYHLTVLFVDASDQLRAKLAAAFFEQVAEWNGYSRCLLPSSAGLAAVEHRSRWDWSLQAGLMARAQMLGLAPKVFARPPEPFEPCDLDMFDVVVAVDSATRSAILARVDVEHRAFYEDKLRLLSEFGQAPQPLSDADVAAVGGSALMPRRFSRVLQPDLPALRRVVDLPRPLLNDAGSAERWDACVKTAMLGSAGLVRYLIDSYPDDLPEYDPL